MKETQKFLTKITCYESIVSDVPSNKLYNWYGSAMNRILCFYENKILQVIMDELNSKNIEILAPMFDGCMHYGISDDNILRELEEAIANKFPLLDMKLSFKSHSKDIEMPETFEIPTEKPTIENDKLNTFEKVASEFEKHHCKIINKAVFVKTFENDTIVMSKQALKASYENLIYEKLDKEGNVIVDNFINDWMVNNPKQLCYDDIGVFPDGLVCPTNIFNMWRKFAMEEITEYEPKEKELKDILNHIKVLCGNDEVVYDYFVKWIAQMIQFPAVKSICPTLISKQGAGKGTLMKLLGAMLGSAKVYETTSPSRDVWGDFNGRMCNTFLINLNELSKKETLECEGKIKGLITDPKLTINNKGVNQYDINSFHRFIITTNNGEPINTSHDDRRNLIIRSSDEKCGDKEYFNGLHKMLEDVNVVKTCYEYFKGIANMDKFNSIEIPTTTYQSNLKQLSVSPIEQWLEAFTIQNYKKEQVELIGAETCKLFKDWCASNDIKYDVDATKLGVRIANLNINGIERGRHTNKGWTKIYNIAQLKKHFKIGCLIQMEEKNEIEESDY
jgi:putative DNA primase/helicase